MFCNAKIASETFTMLADATRASLGLLPDSGMRLAFMADFIESAVATHPPPSPCRRIAAGNLSKVLEVHAQTAALGNQRLACGYLLVIGKPKCSADSRCHISAAIDRLIHLCLAPRIIWPRWRR